MTHNLIYGLTTIIAMTASTAYAAMIEVTPNLNDFAGLAYAADFSCAKTNNATCYYCGSSSSCPTGCSNYIQVNTGASQVIGESAIGCLGNRFCIAPRNGILTYKDGNTSSTDYVFYGFISDDAAHCRRKIGPSWCSNWATSAVTVSGYPFCRCTTATSLTSIPCNICEQNYYLSDTQCTECPCMNDKDNISRCGTTVSIGSTSVTSCRMSGEYTFKDATGEYKFDPYCNASE